MRSEFLPFSRPSIGGAEINAVTEVLKSGWITTGPKNAEFEKDFRDYTGCQNAVGLCSATAGMHILLKALGIGPGDEVVTPSMTWVSTVNLITLSGATPVFADIDRDTLCVTPESVESVITPKTKLIIPVHFAGAPADIGGIRAVAAKHGARVVEDAAHAVGTEFRGERIGKTGTAIFSFHPIKNLTTGEGGMLCADDNALADHIKRLKFHGLGVDAFDRRMQGRSPQAQVVEPGYKYNMTDISAALGIQQLRRLDAMNAKRVELAAAYHERLAGIPELIPLKSPAFPHKHTWNLFILRVDSDKAGISRDDFMAALKERNIGTGLHFRAVHTQKYYRENMKVPAGALPNTEWNSDRMMSIPFFPDMTSADLDDVVNALKDVLAHAKH
jgi:UDP-4-amino-4-deoxy-L-arabinose-oxoglutarate aminotransferase